MAETLTDGEIATYLNEVKILPDDYQSKVTVRPKRGHKERELEITGEDGTGFVVLLRQAIPNPLAFSVILDCYPKGTNQLFRLRRFNGKSHEHTNKIEGNRFSVSTSNRDHIRIGFQETNQGHGEIKLSKSPEELVR